MTTEAARRIGSEQTSQASESRRWLIRVSCDTALAVLMSTAAPVAAESAGPDGTAPLAGGRGRTWPWSTITCSPAPRERSNEAEERTAALRTRRLPALRLDAYEFRWLNDLDFTIPAGALGTAPPLGPLPPRTAR